MYKNASESQMKLSFTTLFQECFQNVPHWSISRNYIHTRKHHKNLFCSWEKSASFNKVERI